MASGTQPKQDELTCWDLRVADLECRVAEQERRVACEAGEGLGAREVLHFMEQTLECSARPRARFAAAPVTPFSCVLSNETKIHCRIASPWLRVEILVRAWRGRRKG